MGKKDPSAMESWQEFSRSVNMDKEHCYTKLYIPFCKQYSLFCWLYVILVDCFPAKAKPNLLQRSVSSLLSFCHYTFGPVETVVFRRLHCHRSLDLKPDAEIE